jgi:hypothetical protein
MARGNFLIAHSKIVYFEVLPTSSHPVSDQVANPPDGLHRSFHRVPWA